MRFRPSTIALVAVNAFVLAGLTVADRAISSANESRVRTDAQEAAAHVRSFLAAHGAALGAFQALLATPGPVALDRSRFASMVGAMRAHAPAFRRIWVADSAGRILHDVSFGTDGRIVSEAGPLAALPALVATPSPSLRVAVVVTPTGAREVALVTSVYVGRSFAGMVGGTVAGSSLRDQLPAQPDGVRARTVITVNGDTLLADTTVTVPSHSPQASVVVPFPGSGAWRVTVTHAARRGVLRAVLWGAGVGALLALTLGLVHERRQARRIAERSAELERLSGELLRANKAKSEFLANVSHELRTPLNAIVGFTDLLRDGVYGELSPRQVGPVQRIEASANNLRHLVDQVLDLAKIAAGRLEVHSESVALRPFVLDVASEVESLVSEKALSLSISVGASLPRVRTDPSHLRQILVNLLGNAVKYTAVGSVAVRGRLVGPPGVVPRPARVTGDLPPLELAPDPERVWIALQVVDSGVGIAPADQERIFGEFEQVSSSLRGDSMRRGTGLGLSISRRLAHLLGGDITVESDVGRGSTFTLWLPVDAADLQEQRRASSVERATPASASALAGVAAVRSTLSGYPSSPGNGIEAGQLEDATRPMPEGSRVDERPDVRR
jgi:signal transduction histidine kinase